MATGSGNGPMSMERQAEDWACVIDVPAGGFSGRAPMLLHTGRPLIIVERGDGHYTDRTWYSQWMEPMVNYIPTKMNAEDAAASIRLALSEKGRAIGANAQSVAKQHLTTRAAIEAWADILATTRSRS